MNEIRNIGPIPYASYLNVSSYNALIAQPNMGYNYPSEYQHLVHDHWRNFPAPTISQRIFFYIIYCVLLSVSLFGNGLVLLIFTTSKSLRTPSNMLIINLAVFDLVMWTNLPLNLMNSSYGYFVGGDIGCAIFATLGSISGIGEAINNAFIAYDRYRTISNPIDGRLSYMQIWILILISWLWTLPFTILPLLKIWGRFMPEGFLTIASFDYLTDTLENIYFIWAIFIWSFVIPLIIIITYYTKLFFHVRDHERMLAEQAKKMNVKSLSANASNDSMSVELRIAKVAMYIWLLFMFAWMPYTIVSLLPTFGYSHLITPVLSMIPAICAKSVSCIDPWVYAASHPKYRAELERRFPWMGIRERGNAQKNSQEGTEAGTIVMD